jgi:hypothetical protein
MTHPRRLGAIVVIAALAVLIASAPAAAQAARTALKAATVDVTRATGQVEVQRKGQGAWSRATAGTKLGEGDHVRALAGGSADLAYPDGSTVLLAENSRLVMTKLEYDPATRSRNIASHLGVGKIKAEVKRAAVELIRARQANFHISTPVGVAAVRGTVVFIAFNPSTNQLFVAAAPSPGQPPISAVVTLVGFGAAGAPPVAVTITGNQFTTQVGTAPPSAPQPIQSLPPAVQAGLGSASNPATASNTNLVGDIQVVSAEQIQVIVVASPPPAPPAPPPPPPSEPRS